MKLNYDVPLSNFAFKFNLSHFLEALSSNETPKEWEEEKVSDGPVEPGAEDSSMAGRCRQPRTCSHVVNLTDPIAIPARGKELKCVPNRT